MTFEDPVWLYLTPLVALAAAGILAYGLRRREAMLARFAAGRLLEKLTEQADVKRSIIKASLVVLGLAAIGLAIARPQYGVEWSERKARGLDIVFVLDSSKSMLATDLRPTRLARAKLAILDLVERLESDRIGLVAFAGQAFLQTPPTLDYSAFRESLESVDPKVMTRGGSDLGRALKEAAKAFPAENNYKVVVLLTDGEDLQGGALEAVRQAGNNGIKVYAIGIGTPEGDYLKIKNEQGTEEFVRDEAGQPVRSQLDERTLQEIARLTGGSYGRLSSESLDSLFSSVISTLPRTERESEMQEVRIERFQWLLSAACLLLVVDILIRRRKINSGVNLFIVALIYGLIHSPELHGQEVEANAAILEDALALELPADSENLSHEEPIQKTATSLYNEAHSLIEQRDFEAAKQHYDAAIRAPQATLEVQRDAAYNAAHSTFQLGESAFQAQNFESTIELWNASEASFRAAHEIDPEDLQALEDAELVAARRKALEEFLQQQEPPDQQQEDQEQDQSGDSEQDDQQESGDSEEDQEQQENNESGEDGEPQDSGSEGERGEQDSENPRDPNNEDSEQQDNSSGDGDQEENGDSQPGAQPPEEETTSDEESQPLPEQGEETAEEDQEAPAPGTGPESGEAGDSSAGASAQSDAEVIEGMTEHEARALLDSLQNNEQLLPFIEEVEPRSRSLKDW
ncbi:MAG: VWA domain-containing protein [Coraliomargarita sp.]